jgi:hypothetical protein
MPLLPMLILSTSDILCIESFYGEKTTTTIAMMESFTDFMFKAVTFLSRKNGNLPPAMPMQTATRAITAVNVKAMMHLIKLRL